MVFLARKEIFRPLDLKVILALLWEGAFARKVTSFLLTLAIVLKTQRCRLIYESGGAHTHEKGLAVRFRVYL